MSNLILETLRRWCVGPYINQEGRENLLKYKYAGGDKGYAYIHFYNPVATRLVEFLPEWIAPNVLTLIGFFFATLPFLILFGAYGSQFNNPYGDNAKP